MARKISSKTSTVSAKKHTAVPVAAPAPVKTPVTVKPQAAATQAVVASPTPAVAPTPVHTPAVTPVVAAESATQAAVSQQLEALRSDDADIACDAAIALGNLGSTAAVEPLIAVLTNADGFFHPVVRAAAAASLGQLKDRRAIQALIHTVSDSLAEPSAEAIRALGALGDSQAVSTLIDVISNYGFYLGTSRRAAVLALAKLGGETAIAALRAVAADSWEDALIRSEAEDAVNAASSR